MIDFISGRQRAANYIMICRNLVDSYPEGTPHGLQKDAIQNAVDARRGKRTVNLSFELIKNRKGKFFTITDSNTTGLTGPVFYGLNEYEDDLPTDYHWARFESFAFTKDDPNAIGARGQGKFIFLGTSKNYIMYYDTLREDGVYRLGGTQATRTGCPILPPHGVKPWEGEEGIRELLDRTGLNPLREIGTRIIIENPVDEFCESLNNGDFIKAIEETWFRLFEKGILNVVVKTDKFTKSISTPLPYPLPSKDSKDNKVWILGNDFHEREIVANDTKFRIKNFHAVYFEKDEVPAEMRGISILHNGMKITTLDMLIAPQEVKNKVAGFIEFDSELDQELRKGENQNPNHYDLKWRRKIPFAIKGYVSKQLEEFGIKKLDLGKDPREIKRSRRTNAEDWALRQLLKHAVGLDLFGSKGRAGKGPNPPPPPPPPPLKPIGVSIHNFIFPSPELAPRINWESAFLNLTVTAHNHTKEDKDVSLIVQVLLGDTTIYQPFERLSFKLSSQNVFHSPQFDINIDKVRFGEPGEYRLSATLFDGKTGDKIDNVARRFWVEKDPILRYPFNVEGSPGFPDVFKFRQWITSGSINNSPTLFYNTAHPCYRNAEDDPDMQREYIFEMVLEGAIKFVLDRPNQEDGAPDFHPLNAETILGDSKQRERKESDKEEIPSRTYEEIHRYASEIRWKVYEGA